MVAAHPGPAGRYRGHRLSAGLFPSLRPVGAVASDLGDVHCRHELGRGRGDFSVFLGSPKSPAPRRPLPAGGGRSRGLAARNGRAGDHSAGAAGQSSDSAADLGAGAAVCAVSRHLAGGDRPRSLQPGGARSPDGRSDRKSR